MEILSMENLTFTYNRSADNRAALKDISLKAFEGDLILLCGPSGGGKTSLLRIIKSSLMPDGKLEGHISAYVPDEKIGYVFQQPDSQLVMEKVFDELIFGCENMGLSTSEINLRLSEITTFFGIEDLTDRECASLSGGQKQLVNLASVLMMEPDILIFDEPLSQLDPIAATFFINIIKKLHDELGMTIIICEHELSDILPYASKVWFMDDGSVMEFSSPDSFVGHIVRNDNKYLCLLPPLIRAAISYDSSLSTYPYSVDAFKKLNIPKAFLDNYIDNERVNKPLNTDDEDITADKNILGLKRKKNKHIPSDLQPVWGKKLYFKYEKNDRDILKGLNIHIPYNSFYAIIGGNGSGKSTLLSLMTGYRTPYKGKFTGLLSDDINRLLCVSYLPQNPLYMFKETCLLNDYLEIMHKFNISENDRVDFSKLFISNPLFMPLKDLLSHNASEISGGELQAAAILLLHLLKRPILLLDEPTKGMDSIYKKNLSAYLKELRESGTTIIMVSHDLEFVCENATHCGLMYDGQIIAEDECHKILKNNKFYTTSLFRSMRKDLS